MNINYSDLCQKDECKLNAVALVFSAKKNEVMKVCRDHLETVCLESYPKGIIECKNCGCRNPHGRGI